MSEQPIPTAPGGPTLVGTYDLTLEEPEEVDVFKNPFESRRLWIALITVVLNALVASYPPLANVKEQLIKILSLLAVTLIGGFSVTHAMDRIESVIKSRRFWVAIGTAFVSIAVLFWPPLEQISTEVVDLIVYLGMALIGGLTLTDMALLRGWTTKK